MTKPKKTREEWAQEFKCWQPTNLVGLTADLVMESQQLRQELQVLRMERAKLLKRMDVLKGKTEPCQGGDK